MKKKYFLVLVLFIVGSSCFALPQFKTDDLPAIDMPFVQAFMDFSAMFSRFLVYARKLGILFGFLCIIFNAFKLWSSTAEIKKVYVDSIYKAVMFCAVMFLYPTITETVLSLSCKIGISASGGESSLNNAFSELGMKMKSNYDKTMNDVLSLITQGQQEGKKNYISDDTLKNFYSMGKSNEEIKEWAKNNNYEIIYKHEETTYDGMGSEIYNVYYTDEKGNIVPVQHSFGGNVFASSRQKSAQKKANKVLSGKNVNVTDENGNKKVISGKQLNQTLVLIRAMLQVTTYVDDEDLQNENGTIDTNKLISEGLANINKIVYSPYLDGADGTPTYILSMSRMLRTGILVSEICSFGVSHYYDEKKGQFVEIKLSEEKGGIVFGSIMRLIKYLFYWLGILLAMICILCEYALTILEYRIISSMAIILVPLLFLDATKSYAQNLIRLFLQYFFKIMVIMVCCFFTLSMYLRLGVMMLEKTDLQSSSTVCLYLFTLIFGTLLTLESGKIASALISGNPTMGIGELVHMGHDMSHIAQMGSRAIHNTAGAVKGAVHGAQSAVGAGVRYHENMNNIRSAASETAKSHHQNLIDDARHGSTSESKDRLASSRGVYNSAVNAGRRQMMADGLFKAFTGMDRNQVKGDNNNAISIGSKDANGQTISVDRLKGNAKNISDDIAAKEYQKMQVHVPEAEKDRKKDPTKGGMMPEPEK